MAALLVLLLSSVFISNGYAHEPDSNTLYDTLTGKTVKEIIESFQATGDELLGRAHRHRNGLLLRAANESNVLAANIDFRLHNRIDQVFDRLGESEKKTLISAEKMRLELKQTREDAYTLKQTSILDLNSLAATLPFVKNTFFVQAIKGLSYIPSEKNYTFKLYASKIGVIEKQQTSIHLLVQGKPVALKRVDLASEKGVATVEIGNDVFAPYFQDRSLNDVSATIVVTIKKSGRFAKAQTYAIPVHFTFYPKIAGDVTLSGFQPVYAWVPLQGSPIVEQLWTSDDSCQSSKTKFCPAKESYNNLHYSVSGGAAPTVGHQRIRKANLMCAAGTYASSSKSSQKQGWSNHVTLSHYNTVVNATWATKGMPGLWKLSVYLDEYQQIATKPWNGKLQEFRYGDVLNTLTLPSDILNQTLNVKTFSGLKYSIPVGASDPHGYLNYFSRSTESPRIQRLQYTVGYPDDVNL